MRSRLASTAASLRSAATHRSSAHVRAVSDFAYVNPGPVAPRRHVLRFRESERDEVWKHEGIPILDDGLPEEARGRVMEHYLELATAVEEQLEEAVRKSPRIAYVHALLEHFGPSVAGVLSEAELKELTTEPSEEEVQRLRSPVERRRALLGLRKELDLLMSSAQLREEDALDSGEADLALPLSVETREAMQAANSKDLFLAALKVARTMSMIVSIQEAGLSAQERAHLADAIDAANGPVVLGHASASPMEAAGNGYVNPADAPLSREEVAEFTHGGETYENLMSQALAHGDRLAKLPRKRLPTPLHADAPNAHLADVARLIDTNPSYSSAEDKAYMLQYYADALSGKAEAFDIGPEKAAFMDPQPQWGVYDPQLVKMQDGAQDALQGKGQFSQTAGEPWADVLVPPSSAGAPDINPSRAPLTGSEEVAGVLKAYDVSVRAEIDTASAAVTTMLERAMGLPAGRLAKQQRAASASAGSKAAGGGAGDQQAAALAAKRQAQQQKQGKGGDKQAAPAAAASGGVADDVAEAVIKSFFTRWKAGEKVAQPPVPPPVGPKPEFPNAKPPPAAKAAPAKGKKK